MITEPVTPDESAFLDRVSGAYRDPANPHDCELYRVKGAHHPILWDGKWECSECSFPSALTYETIVYLDGDEATEVIDMLYNWTRDHLHVHYSGTTGASIQRASDYLAQWDYGDPSEPCERPSVDNSGDLFTSADGLYIMTASLSYGWISLTRVITE